MNRARGFTLIEVMITMFVIAVGLLSSAALQALSKKVNYDAVQRTTATMLAQSIVERMRANPGQLVSYLTNDASSVSAGTDCGAAGAACGAADLAAYDLATWARSLQGSESTNKESTNAGGLVAPTGCIYQDKGTTGLYIVAIAWRGITGMDAANISDAADDPQQLTCGQNLGRYDDPAWPGSDERLRRIVAIRTFIANPYVYP